MFTFNYKGRMYSDEEVAKRMKIAISLESDINIRMLLMNLKGHSGTDPLCPGFAKFIVKDS